MPATIDFHELVRALEEHPEWRQELRRLLLTDEILRLPELVREIAEEVRQLAEAQRRTEQRVEELAEAQRRTDQRLEELSAEVRLLAEAQRRTEQRVEELAEAQRRTEQRVEELAEAQRRTEQRVEELAEAQRRTDQRLEELSAEVRLLAEAQRRTEQRVEELAEAQRQLAAVQMHMERRLQRVEVRLDRLWGHDVERRYRERAAAYFGRLLSDVEALDTQALAKLLDQARKAGRITHEERQEILWADVVVRGENQEGLPVVFLLEVSSVVGFEDVERAKRRADLCSKALGVPVYPAVAGEEIPEEVAALCQAQGVWQLADGRAFPPPSAPSS